MLKGNANIFCILVFRKRAFAMNFLKIFGEYLSRLCLIFYTSFPFRNGWLPVVFIGAEQREAFFRVVNARRVRAGCPSFLYRRLTKPLHKSGFFNWKGGTLRQDLRCCQSTVSFRMDDRGAALRAPRDRLMRVKGPPVPL